jgi:hypothetical protein
MSDVTRRPDAAAAGERQAGASGGSRGNCEVKVWDAAP